MILQRFCLIQQYSPDMPLQYVLSILKLALFYMESGKQPAQFSLMFLTFIRDQVPYWQNV